MNSFGSDQEPRKTPKFVKPLLNALDQIYRSDAGSIEQSEEQAKKNLKTLLDDSEKAIVTAGAQGSIGINRTHRQPCYCCF